MFGNGMNYGNMFQSGFNPYSTGSKLGLLNSIKRFNWGNLLNNTQRTLGIINQAIPVFYQIRPIWNNAKTMFRVASAIREDKDDTTNINQAQVNSNNNIDTSSNHITYNENKPIFFV